MLSLPLNGLSSDLIWPWSYTPIRAIQHMQLCQWSCTFPTASLTGSLFFTQAYFGIARIQTNKNTFGGCTVPLGLCLLVCVDDRPPVIYCEKLALL